MHVANNARGPRNNLAERELNAVGDPQEPQQIVAKVARALRGCSGAAAALRRTTPDCCEQCSRASANLHRMSPEPCDRCSVEHEKYVLSVARTAMLVDDVCIFV